MQKLLYRWLLPKLIANTCESRIPRSGEEGKKVNCFIVALDRDRSPYFVATGYEEGRLIGLVWNGERYATEHSLNIDDLSGGELKITHYYGLSEIEYRNIYDATWNFVTRIVYAKISIERYLRSTYQYLFNKRKLITKKRMELLHFMMNDQLDREHAGINSLDLMTRLYSISWVLHPSVDEQMKKLELYLESLVKSGDLAVANNDEYTVTGKAVSTLEKYEEEERRHTEAVKLQKRTVWLTLLLAFIALMQSGVFKLPVLFDLSAPASREAHAEDTR